MNIDKLMMWFFVTQFIGGTLILILLVVYLRWLNRQYHRGKKNQSLPRDIGEPRDMPTGSQARHSISKSTPNKHHENISNRS